MPEKIFSYWEIYNAYLYARISGMLHNQETFLTLSLLQVQYFFPLPCLLTRRRGEWCPPGHVLGISELKKSFRNDFLKLITDIENMEVWVKHELYFIFYFFFEQIIGNYCKIMKETSLFLKKLRKFLKSRYCVFLYFYH